VGLLAALRERWAVPTDAATPAAAAANAAESKPHTNGTAAFIV